jgi:alpha-tubulin suppressor-like RCC1 family protein
MNYERPIAKFLGIVALLPPIACGSGSDAGRGESARTPMAGESSSGSNSASSGGAGTESSGSVPDGGGASSSDGGGGQSSASTSSSGSSGGSGDAGVDAGVEAGGSEGGSTGSGSSSGSADNQDGGTALTGVKAISAGGGHACALLTNGTVVCWGFNEYGELGNGSTSPPTGDSKTPVAVTGLTGVVAISAGDLHTCAVLSGGTVQCWGHNAYGQLGNGSTTDSDTPVTVTGLTGAVGVSAGDTSTCAVLTGGTVQCWGDNAEGQLGTGSTSTATVTTPIAVSGLVGATSVSVGFESACAVLTGGTLQCWGTSYESVTTPPLTVSGLAGVIQASVSFEHTCALLSGGTVECWGENVQGQLGNGCALDQGCGGPTAVGSKTPVAVTGLTDATGVSTSSADDGSGGASCALLMDSTVECWGFNSVDSSSNDAPYAVAGLSGVTAVSSGNAEFACALRTGGSVECWGKNDTGELGNGSTVAYSVTPVAVSTP